jgi:hypothetical protein
MLLFFKKNIVLRQKKTGQLTWIKYLKKIIIGINDSILQVTHLA